MKWKGGIAFGLAATLGVVVGSALARPSESQVASAAAECRSSSLGIAAPLTGPAAFLGQEQLSWAQFAAAQFNAQYKTNFKIAQGDTQLSASLARTVGRRFVSNKSIIGIIGPSTSQAVISSAGLFKVASLAAVTPSATRTDLTNGSTRPSSGSTRTMPFSPRPSRTSREHAEGERGGRRLAGRLLDGTRERP